MASSDIELVGLGELVKDLERISTKMNKKALAKMLRPGAVIFQRDTSASPCTHWDSAQERRNQSRQRGKATDPTATLFTYFRKIYKTPPKGEDVRAILCADGAQRHGGWHEKAKHRKPRTFSRSEERAYQRQR